MRAVELVVYKLLNFINLQAITVKYCELYNIKGKGWFARHIFPFFITNNIGCNILITSDVLGIILCIFHIVFITKL